MPSEPTSAAEVPHLDRANAAEVEIARLREFLDWIADPSYIGNYSDAEVVNIYRAWAHNALIGEKP